MGSANTRFQFSTQSWSDIQTDGLIVPVFRKPAPKQSGSASSSKTKKENQADALLLDASHKALDKALQGQILTAAREEKFDGGPGKMLVFRKTPGDQIQARRVILIGLGEADKLKPHQVESHLQKAMGSVLALNDAHSGAIVLPEETRRIQREAMIQAVVDAVCLATYRSAEAKEKSPDLKEVALLIQSTASSADKTALSLGQALAQGRSAAKDLVNMPSNLKTTDTLVNKAKAIGKLSGLKTRIQADQKWLQKEMPCFFTVAQGSLASDPPKFITIQYKPTGGGRVKKRIALIGKSVIFDTGGYQVKPGNSMNTMKGDMTGGAIVISVMEALAELQPRNIEVTAYMAATPNKIDSGAMIPDSIVNTTCGKKVEIRHTDAEGRLTLIDAVAKAVEDKPDEILTLATLTGSASVAVGLTVALMGNDAAETAGLTQRILQAGRALGEPIQMLDITEEDYNNIKSKLDAADIINTSQKRERGCQSAATFVMSGAPEDMPLAHMDIAGADMTPDEKATGIGFKTLLNYLVQENGGISTPKATPASKKPTATKTSAAKPKKAASKPPAKGKSKTGSAKKR